MGGVGGCFDDAGIGIWMGRAFPEVFGRARRHVVASKSRSGVSVQVNPAFILTWHMMTMNLCASIEFIIAQLLTKITKYQNWNSSLLLKQLRNFW